MSSLKVFKTGMYFQQLKKMKQVRYTSLMETSEHELPRTEQSTSWYICFLVHLLGILFSGLDGHSEPSCSFTKPR